METEIIKLWDNEDYDYPMIEIRKGFFEALKEELDEYRKNEEYNFDGFLEILKKKHWFVGEKNSDNSLFF